MNRDSMKKLMDLIDDPEFKDTILRVEENLDRVDRMKDARRNPPEGKTRIKTLEASLDDEIRKKAAAAAGGVGLVLTGGGAKGSYQAGALKAIKEKELFSGLSSLSDHFTPGLQITGLAGTSAGALNAAMYAAGDTANIEEMWAGIIEERMVGKDGFFSLSEDNDHYLESLIRDSGLLTGLSMDSILTIATAFDVETGHPRDFILNKMSYEEKIRALMASAAFPLALTEQKIGGKTYIDGGIPFFGSNMPVAPLYHLGFRRFLVIHCSSRKEAAEAAGLSGMNVKLNQEQYYNGAVFVHLYAKKDLGGLLEGTANFNHDVIMGNMDLGYSDMLEAGKDLEALFNLPGPLDELHIVGGDRYRSFIEFLEG